MLKIAYRIAAVFIFAYVAVGIGLGFSPDARAQPTGCDIEIVKSSSPANNTVFTFEIVSGAIVFELPLRDPDNTSFETGIDPGQTATVTELPVGGWELGGIECEAEGDVDFFIGGASVTIDCSDDGGAISCTFSNFLASRPIPTLSEWGLIAMAGVLALAGFLVLRRRKLTA